MSLDTDTAYREGNQAFYQIARTMAGPDLLAAGGLRPDPVVLIGVWIRASRLLDLRDLTTRQNLGIEATTELVAPWLGVPNAPTQVLGDTVFNDGHFEGLIFPSAQNPGHDCLVVFPGRLLATSRLAFSDVTAGLEARLP